jgi:hypothetical protein
MIWNILFQTAVLSTYTIITIKGFIATKHFFENMDE